MNNKNKYSPKESLGLLIIANENVNFKEMDNLILSLEQVLLQNKTKTEILEHISVDLLSQIDNYWELKKSQVIAYGYLVFNHFRISCEELTSENITNEATNQTVNEISPETVKRNAKYVIQAIADSELANRDSNE